MHGMARNSNDISNGLPMTLPTCIQRGRIFGDACECFSNHFAGGGYAIRPLTVCTRPCPFLNVPNRGPRPTRELRRTACVYIGRILSRTDASGKPCNCPTKWTRHCEIHGECSLIESRREVQHCQTCPDYEPR